MARARAARISAALLAGLLLPWLLAAVVSEAPAPIVVWVGAQARYTPAGAQLATLALTPPAGSLLDVRGTPLEPHRFPGHVTVNGRPAGPATVLAANDRISLVPGRDRTEPVRTIVTRAPTGQPADPEYTLGRAPGEWVSVVGRLSGETARTTFRATGPVQTPRAVALTFDDGPWPSSTLAILHVLHRFRAPATFFLIGRQVPEWPDLVRAERRADVEIEDHSWDHPLQPPLSHLGLSRIRAEISLAAAAEQRLGVHPTLFRPPGGSWSNQVRTLAAAQGMRLVLWSVDPRDWAPGATARGIAHAVLSHVQPGSIVLLHDGGGNRSATVRALPRIITGIRHRHLRLTTVEP